MIGGAPVDPDLLRLFMLFGFGLLALGIGSFVVLYCRAPRTDSGQRRRRASSGDP